MIGENKDGESFGLTRTEEKSYFSMWCVMGAPLFLGTNLTQMSDETFSIISNEELIKVDQDPLGLQAVKVADEDDLQVWCKRLEGEGRRAVVLFNRSEKSAAITADFTDLGLQGKVKVRDLWLHQDRGEFDGSYTASVLPHGVVALLVKGEERAAHDIYLSDVFFEVIENGKDFEPVRKDESPFDRRPIWIGDDKIYSKGLCVKTPSVIRVSLDGKYDKFKSDIGVDYPAFRPGGQAVFQIYLDRKKVYDSGLMTTDTPKKQLNIDVSGGNILRLVVISVKDEDTGKAKKDEIPTIVVQDQNSEGFSTWADWADAKLIAAEKEAIR